MATNKYWMIPGASRPSKSVVSKAYVDNIFTTLSGNLNTKMDRIGGNFTGDIHMADKNITISHTPMSDHDVTNKKYVDTAVNNHVLLTTDTDSETKLDLKVSKSGDIMSGILNLGSNAIKTTHTPISGEDVINKRYFDELISRRLNSDDLQHIENKLSLKVNRTGDTLTGPVDFGNNRLTSSYIPSNDNDILNKKFLKSIYIKNSHGYIPELIKKSLNKSGFIITSSGDIPEYPAYSAFTPWKPHWLPSDKQNGWLQIELPEFIRIFKFALCGKVSGGSLTDQINSFSLLARKNVSVDWVVLFTTTDEQPLDNEVSFFHMNNTSTFKFFKFQIHRSIGDTPGISFFQLYCLDSIE